MTTIKEAIKASIDFLKSIDTDVQEVLVEEVEMGATSWLITLSYIHYKTNILSTQRKYRIFKVHQTSGDVMSMKIREFSTAA